MHQAKCGATRGAKVKTNWRRRRCGKALKRPNRGIGLVGISDSIATLRVEVPRSPASMCRLRHRHGGSSATEDRPAGFSRRKSMIEGRQTSMPTTIGSPPLVPFRLSGRRRPQPAYGGGHAQPAVGRQRGRYRRAHLPTPAPQPLGDRADTAPFSRPAASTLGPAVCLVDNRWWRTRRAALM